MTPPKPDLEIALTLLAAGATALAVVGVLDPVRRAGWQVLALGAVALVSLALSPWWPPAALVASGANLLAAIRLWWSPGLQSILGGYNIPGEPPGRTWNPWGWAFTLILVANLLGAVLSLATGALWRERRLREAGLGGRRTDWLFHTAGCGLGIAIFAAVALVILLYGVSV